MRRSLQASLAILKADVASLSRSWVLRGWLAALLLAEFFLIATTIVGLRSIRVPASNIIATNLGGFLLIWSTLIIVISAGSVSLEADIISDSILSRACTRTQFIVAKLLGRSVVILGIYLVAASIVAYAAYRYAAADVTPATMAVAISVVGLALLLLVSLGVLFSVVFNNTIVSVVALLLLWYVASPIFVFAGAEYLSPASLVRNLPAVLKDPQSPQVLHCSATKTSLTVVFSEDVDQEAAENPANYEIECPPGNDQVAQTAAYDRTRAAVTLSGLTLGGGQTVRVRVRNVSDRGGTMISEAADSAECEVPDPLATGHSAEKPKKSDAAPPRLLRISAAPSSIRAFFSESLDQVTAEDPANYRIENPIGSPQAPRAASYEPSRRSVLLSGLRLDLHVPMKLTVTNVRDEAGNAIRAPANSIVQTEVTPWRYALGFGVPALVAAALAVLWFNRRDL